MKAVAPQGHCRTEANVEALAPQEHSRVEVRVYDSRRKNLSGAPVARDGVMKAMKAWR